MAILSQTRSASWPQPCLSDSGLWRLRERTRCSTVIFLYIFFHICGLELLGQEVAFVFVLTFLRGPFLCSHSHGLFIAFYSSHFLTCKRNSSLFLKTPGITKSRSLNFFQNSRLVHLTAIIAIGYYKNYLCIYFEKHLFII